MTDLDAIRASWQWSPDPVRPVETDAEPTVLTFTPSSPDLNVLERWAGCYLRAVLVVLVALTAVVVLRRVVR